MRTLVFLGLLLPFWCCSFAQELSFEKVTYLDSTLSDSQIYQAADAFFSTFAAEMNMAKTSASAENKQIVLTAKLGFVQGSLAGSDCTRGLIDCVVQFNARQGRYRLKIYSFYHTGSPCSGGAKNFKTILDSDLCTLESWGFAWPKSWIKGVCNDLRTEIASFCNYVFAEAEKRIRPGEDKKEDW